MDSSEVILTASAPIRIIFSAGSYLLDFVTNVVTLIEYYTFHDQLLRRSFYLLLFTLAGAHVINVLVFKMKLDKKDQPVRAAYFLPLMQLWRLIQVLRTTCGLRGLVNDISDERSNLYSILSVTLETSPALAVQYAAIYQKKITTPGDDAGTPVLIVSIVAAFLSGGFNGGMAVMSKAKNAISGMEKAGIAILAGTYTVCAMLLRCISCSVFTIIQLEVLPLVVGIMMSTYIIYLLLYWLVLAPGTLKSQFTLKRFTNAMLLASMSSTISPLYPVLSDANERNQLGTMQYRLRLLFMAIVHSAPEMVAWAVLFKCRHPKNVVDNMFLLRFGVAQAVYFASLQGIVLLDYHCGSVKLCHDQPQDSSMLGEGGVTRQNQGKQLNEQSLGTSSLEECKMEPNNQHHQHFCIDHSNFTLINTVMYRIEHMAYSQVLPKASIAVSIVLSSGCYLLDFATNIATLIEYYKFKDNLMLDCFYLLIVAILIAHTANVFVFKIKIDKKERPVKAAYFLPLIQLWRLIQLLQTACGLKEFKELVFDEKTNLYSILSVTLETVPALLIQYGELYRRIFNSTGSAVSPVLILSTAASFASGGFNGGMAVLSQARNAKTTVEKLEMAVMAGSYLVCAMLLRCTTFSLFFIFHIPPWLFVICIMQPLFVVYGLLYWLVLPPAHNRLTWKRFLDSMVAALFSKLIGPLYSLASTAKESNKLGSKEYRLKLLFMSLVHLVPEIGTWLVLIRFHSREGLNTSVWVRMGVAQALYLGSLLGIMLLDQHCGGSINLEQGEVHNQQVLAGS